MRFLASEKIGEHRYKTPEGYLICLDAILARTGKQTYHKNELFDTDDDTEIEVDRKPEEVFSEKTLASFENKPICNEHPSEDVSLDNYKELSVGFVRDIKRKTIDGEDVMTGTLVITDKDAITDIENGKVELSCGYDADIIDEENPQQRNIRGNHVALCEHGRAGIARIIDSTNDGRNPTKPLSLLKNALSSISGFTHGRDYDISAIFELIQSKTSGWFSRKDFVVEQISGWNKMKDGMMRKEYVVSCDTDENKVELRIFLYADPDVWKVSEVSAYVSRILHDSVTDAAMIEKSINELKDIAVENGADRTKLDNLSKEELVVIIDKLKKENDNMKCKIDSENKPENFNNKIILNKKSGLCGDSKAVKIVKFVKAVKQRDALGEFSADTINQIKYQLRMHRFNIVGSGKTMFGNLHFQVEFSGHEKEMLNSLNMLDDWAASKNIPMTYSASYDPENNFATVGITFNNNRIDWEKYTKNSK